MQKYLEAVQYFNLITKAQEANQTPEQTAALAKELANYNIILNIYNQIQDVAALVLNTQFNEIIKNLFVRLQKSAFNFATKAFTNGLSEADSAAHINEIKTMIGGLRAKIPQDVFEPLDLLNQMINTYKPMALSAQNKNKGHAPPPLAALTSKPSPGKLPTSISVQMPIK